MMDDLFASSAAPSVPRIAVVVPVNNDVLLARLCAPASASRAGSVVTRRSDSRSVASNVVMFPRKRPQPGQIALGMTIRGDFVRFSPELRRRLARIVAENRRMGRRS
jgi:hypothetical protein